MVFGTVQCLATKTVLHIPTQFRLVCTITADVEGANRGIEVYALLEETAAKLILAHVPQGTKTAHELRLRLAIVGAPASDRGEPEHAMRARYPRSSLPLQ